MANKFVLVPPGTNPPPSGPTFISYSDERQNYVNYARQMALKYSVPSDLFVRQINMESDFRPDAVSKAGAMGIAQFMPITAKAVGLSDPRNPYKSLEAAAIHMAQLKKSLGSWRLALAAYHAGASRVINAGYQVPNISSTMAYVKAIYRNEDTGEPGKPGQFILKPPSILSQAPLTARGQAETQARSEALGLRAPVLEPTTAGGPGGIVLGGPSKPVQGALVSPGGPSGVAPSPTPLGALAEATQKAFGPFSQTGFRGFLNRVLAEAGLPQAVIEHILTGGRRFEDMAWYTKAVDAVTDHLWRGGTSSYKNREQARLSAQTIISMSSRMFSDPFVIAGMLPYAKGLIGARGIDPVLEGAAARVEQPAAIIKEAAQATKPVESGLEYARRIKVSFTGTPEGVLVKGAAAPVGPEWVTKDFNNMGAARAFREARVREGIEANIWKRGNRYVVTYRSTATEPLEAPKMLPAGTEQPVGAIRQVEHKLTGQKAGTPKGVQGVRATGQALEVPGAVRERTFVGQPDVVLESPKNPLKQLQTQIPDTLERATVVATKPDAIAQAAIVDATRPGFIELAAETGADIAKPGFIEKVAGTLADEQGISRDLLAVAANNVDMLKILRERGKTVWGIVYDNLLTLADTAVRNQGPAGVELVGRMNRVRDLSEVAAGKMYDTILQTLKGLDPYAAVDRISDVREGRLAESALNAKELAAKQIIDQFLDGIATKVLRAKDGAIPIDTLSNEERALLQLKINLLDDYWPHSLNWSRVSLHGNIRDEAVRVLSQRNNIPESLARDILTYYQRRYVHGRPFGNLERARLVPDMPKDLRLHPFDELRRYVEGYYRRVYEVQEYGGPNSELIKDLISQIEATGGDGELAKNLYNARMGYSPFERWRALNDLASSVNDVQTAAKLPFAVIKNSSQLINTALLVDLRSIAKGLDIIAREGMAKEEALSFFNRAGILNAETFRGLREASLGIHKEGSLAESVLGKTGFLRVEGGLNRFGTAIIGREWVRGLTAKLRNGVGAQPYERSWLAGLRENAVVKQFERMGFSSDDINRIRTSGLTDDDEIRAARWLVDETQFATHPGQIPMLASHPMGRMLLLFKSFAIKQGSLLRRAVWDYGLKQGNVKPLLVLGTIFPVVGEGFAYLYNGVKQVVAHPIQTIREPFVAWGTVRGRTPQPIEKGSAMAIRLLRGEGLSYEKGFLSEYGNALAYLGGLGIFSDMLRAGTASPGRIYQQVASFLLGPTGSDIISAGVGTSLLFSKDIPEAARKAFGVEEKELPWLGAKTLAHTTIGATPWGSIGTAALRSNLQTPEARRREYRRLANEAADRGDWTTYEYYYNKMTEP